MRRYGGGGLSYWYFNSTCDAIKQGKGGKGREQIRCRWAGERTNGAHCRLDRGLAGLQISNMGYCEGVSYRRGAAASPNRAILVTTPRVSAVTEEKGGGGGAAGS